MLHVIIVIRFLLKCCTTPAESRSIFKHLQRLGSVVNLIFMYICVLKMSISLHHSRSDVAVGEANKMKTFFRKVLFLKCSSYL